jgi:hypothetical protein
MLLSADRLEEILKAIERINPLERRKLDRV